MADTSIDRLTLDIVVNNDNATRRINSVTKAIEKLNTAVSKSGNLDKVLGTLNNVSPTRASSGGGGSKSSGGGMKSLNIFSTLGKWNYYINMARYYGKALAQTVQYAMDYVETQNLWQVANRNNLKMADEFIRKMNKAYGISEQTLMNYQAIFKNMLSALGGISEEISSGLSMQLTQMAVDFSSLYNVAIPDAMTKFQAILSGQVRPIRSVSGYDITENTIFDLYQKAGGEKSMRQLSQLEKRLLRIVAVFDQMDETGALGDMEKTIESASNQARIMAEQTKETLTWTGQLLLMWLNNAGVLQKVNAFLMTTKEIIKSIAYDLGYEEENFLDGLMTSAEGADEAIDKLQGKLLSFDKFEALNPASDNALGLDQTVLDLLGNINVEMANFEMQATKISQKWLETLGYIDQNGDGIYEATENTEKLYDKLKVIGVVLSGISALKLINKIGGINVAVSGLTGLLKIMPTLLTAISSHPIILAITAVVGALVYMLSTSEELRNSFKELGKSVGELLKTLLDLAMPLIKSMGEELKKQIENFKTFLKGITPIITFIVDAITWLVDGINKVLNGIKNFSGEGLSKFISKLNPATWFAPKYATGGFPEDGFFYANSGELVGQFSNGKTAVANNEQIVQGITQGVYSAMMAYNAQTRGQGGSGDVYLDGTKVGKVVAKSSHKEMVRTGLVSVNA